MKLDVRRVRTPRYEGEELLEPEEVRRMAGRLIVPIGSQSHTPTKARASAPTE